MKHVIVCSKASHHEMFWDKPNSFRSVIFYPLDMILRKEFYKSFLPSIQTDGAVVAAVLFSCDFFSTSSTIDDSVSIPNPIEISPYQGQWGSCKYHLA